MCRNEYILVFLAQCSKENKTSNRNPTSPNGLRGTFKLPLFVPYLVALKKVTTAPLADVIWAAFLSLSLSPSPIFPPLPCLSLPTRLWSSLSFGKDKWSEIRRGDSREEERGLCIWGTATPQWYWHSVSWNGLRENTYHIHIHLPEGPLLSHVLRPKYHFIGVQRKTDGIWELCADVWDGQWQKFSSKKGEYEQSKLSSWTLITAIDLWNTYGPMCEDVICVKGLTYSTKS